VSSLSEAEFCQWLTREDRRRGNTAVGVLRRGGFEQGIARLCFAKQDQTLRTALQRLASAVGRVRTRAGGDRLMPDGLTQGAWGR
jgi:hypothetical protein